jgi:hypothetical protein
MPRRFRRCQKRRYTAVFTLAELESTDAAPAPVFADSRNRIAISSALGPYRLPVPYDVTQARCANKTVMHRTLWIVLTVLWIVLGVLSAFGAFASLFLFDAPGSETSPLTIALFWCMVINPVLWFVGAGVPWLFRKKRIGAWLFLIPFVDVTAILIVFVAIDQFCSGALSCHK